MNGRPRPAVRAASVALPVSPAAAPANANGNGTAHRNGNGQAAAGPLVARLHEHATATRAALETLDGEYERIVGWARLVHQRLRAGSRLLVAGNGGSAALAQHLTAELVGRYEGERPAYSAIALTADTAAVTALGNDYGFEHCFARQVRAHGRAGDVLALLTTSGRSANLLEAAAAARPLGVTTLACTGPAPNPLAERADDTLALPVASAAVVQEVQQVVVHLLCDAFDALEAGRD